MSLYVYKAELVRVVDGDTYDLKVDAGFHMTFASRFRLNKYDTPELRRGSDFEKSQAQYVTEWVKEWFAQNPEFYVRTHKSDSFGRWLAEVFSTKSHLGDELFKRDYATRWPQRWNEVHDRNEDV